jgi:Cysteine-rich CPCC
MESKFPCPCCGYLIFERAPGSDQICKICFWHDSIAGLRDPTKATGPNHVSLLHAQQNYQRFGAKELRLKQAVRIAGPNDRKDPGWRPIDLTQDQFNPDPSVKPASREQLYCWRRNYWLRNEHED